MKLKINFNILSVTSYKFYSVSIFFTLHARMHARTHACTHMYKKEKSQVQKI